jgi:hypothetical protein
MKRHLVISNWKSDLEWIKMSGFSKENITIYDRSDNPKDWSHLGKFYLSPNVGENIYDIFRFIIENYDDLPDITIFMKGNMIISETCGEYYYATLDRIKKAFEANTFYPIEKFHGVCKNTGVCPYPTVNDGMYMEPNDNSFTYTGMERKFYNTYNEFLEDNFIDPFFPDYIRFAPGANYTVPKQNILSYSKQFYEKLQSYVSYTIVPLEAHILERALYTMWTCNYQEKL